MRLHDVVQSSPEWHQLRLGIPTASEFSQLVTPTGKPSASLKTYAASLAGELYIGRPINMFSGNAWTERGKELEHQAYALYEFAHDVELQAIGFVTNNEGTAGCSPDAFVGSDGMIEIKSLKADHHIAAIMHYKRTGACPPDYTPQTQGQLMLCERSWVDLVFYHPELPLLSIRQTPQPAMIELLGKQIPALIAERDEVLETIRSLSPAA